MESRYPPTVSSQTDLICQAKSNSEAFDSSRASKLLETELHIVLSSSNRVSTKLGKQPTQPWAVFLESAIAELTFKGIYKRKSLNLGN